MKIQVTFDNEKHVNYLYKQINEQKDELQKTMNILQGISFCLMCRKETIEDPKPSVKQDAVSQNNDQQSSSDQSAEQSDRSEMNLHLVQAV